MTNNLDTLLTALYVFIDDYVVTERSGRGRRPLLSDAELVSLAVAQVLLGYHSERRWVRHIHADERWRKLFPYLPRQSGYHKASQGRPGSVERHDPGVGDGRAVVVRRCVGR